ncbi:hypothetical protein AB9F39_36345, partial [Rhizobium leguminosarum]|uniref:hypothetical protein n=1 Tax=Rhizobium leguminosarum TaxID=384 RepID=UPI003F9C6EF6
INKAGIMIVIKDSDGSAVPGLGQVLNTGALQPADDHQAEATKGDELGSETADIPGRAFHHFS